MSYSQSKYSRSRNVKVSYIGVYNKCKRVGVATKYNTDDMSKPYSTLQISADILRDGNDFETVLRH